jgi:uncharacterized protein (DUF849 family)
MATFLKAAINGARSSSEHPALPTSAETIALQARAVVAAGASAIHFHIRNEQLEESLAAEDATRCISACRSAVPTVPIGVSTGEWIVPDPSQRLALISEWRVLPDFVSVNFHEDGATRVARLFHERGVGIELGLIDASAVDKALAGGWDKRCLRILLEPQDDTFEAALENVIEMVQILDLADVSAPRLLHGFEATAWPMLQEAGRRDYQCRIGLEDTLYLPDGELAAGNVQLVNTAIEMLARETGSA